MKSNFLNVLFMVLLFIQTVYANKTPAMDGSIAIKHPVHISFTNIEYNQNQGKFEILFKFFVDDFDKVLSLKYGKNLNLAGGRWEKNYENLINQYILEHFKLIIGKKDKTKKSLKFIRKETNEDSIWLYYDFNTKEKNNIFEVQNSLMTDFFPDQSNLLIFAFMGEQKAIKFNQSKTIEMFSF